MLEACRTCLKLIDVDNLPFFEIESDDEQLSAESCRSKLLNLIPEMKLNITPKSLMCAECHGSLEAMFEFKAKCQQTENVITQYFRAKPDVDIKNLDLKDVSAFNMSHSADNILSKGKFAEVFIEDFTFKEVVKSFDNSASEGITVIKHEVDDYISENVEMVQPENTELDLVEKSTTGRFSSPNNHLKIHFGVKKYECQVCEKMFSKKKCLKTHKLMQPECRGFPCKYCEKRLISRDSLRRHLDTHDKPYLCEVCNYRFAQKIHLTNHMRTHTGERPYICSICGIGYHSNAILKQHTMTHSKEQPHQCDICQKTFKMPEYLARHRKIHSGKKNFECEQCNKLFINKDSLNKHLRIHTKEKPYRCEMCDHRFGQKIHLQTHLRRHTGEQPYVCAVCSKGFYSNSELTVHMRKHTGERPYQCETCQKTFTRGSKLAEHQRIRCGTENLQKLQKDLLAQAKPEHEALVKNSQEAFLMPKDTL